MNDIEIKIINREHKGDINLKNEPFTIFGRLIPIYDGESWSHTQELFTEKSELRFPDESYDFDAMTDSIFIGAYMDNKCVGLAIMQQAFFKYLSAEYEQEQAELEKVIAEDQSELDAFNADTARVDRFLALARKYTDFTELTTPMINEFVDKILVHEPDRSSGERIQEIEIYLNFVGKFEMPPKEPTPEELAEEQRRLKQREYSRASYLRRKARKEQAITTNQ